MRDWFRDRGNQQLLKLLGPAVAAVALAVWTVFTYFDSSGTTGRPSVEADRGGVAVGGHVGGDIRVGSPPADDAPER
jgi:hypothetical protein